MVPQMRLLVEVQSWDDFVNFLRFYAINIDAAFETCIRLIRKSPFDLLGTSTDMVFDIVKAIAISLLTLFFLMEFFKKSMDFQWIKWENILMFCIKIVFAKVVLDNTMNIMEFIFTVFTNTSLDIMTSFSGTVSTTFSSGGLFNTSGSDEDICGNFLSAAEIDEMKNHAGWCAMGRLLKEIQLLLPLNIIMLVMVITQVVIFVRMFEILIYSMVSPIPLTTFVSDEHKQIGISFIKNYAAVCIQCLIIVIVFIVFATLCSGSTLLSDVGVAAGTTGLMIKVAALGFSVVKSGNWAKKVVGAM